MWREQFMATSTDDHEQEQDLTLWQVIGSTFAAALGVQSKANKTRDFTRGKPLHFIIAGLLGTALFLATLITVVSLVLPD